MSSRLFSEARSVVDAARDVLRDDRARLDVVRERLDGPLRVAIAGRVKAGKSTLLNALVGEELAPTDAGECTKVVTWYQAGRVRRVGIVPRTGKLVNARWSRDDGALDIDLTEWAADDIDHLEVDWPSTELARATLVDTPGLASARRHVSARTEAALTSTDGGPGDADAVIYLLRHLHPEDVSFFESFADAMSGDVAAVNATGVLSRADEIGGATLDSMEVAAATVERYVHDPRLRASLRVIVPVGGLLAMGAITLTEGDMRAFRALARQPMRIVDRALLSAGGFLVDPAVDLDEVARERLLDRFGLFGVRFAVDRMRPKDRSASELSRLLADQSGVEDLRRVLHTQFGDRARVLKARTALAAVKALCARSPDAKSTALLDRIHGVELSAHEFRELVVLQQLQALTGPLPGVDVREAERLLGGDGPSSWQRLDIAPTTPDEEIEDHAIDLIARWRAVAADEFAGRTTREVGEAVVRSLEGIIADLDDRR